METKTNNFSFDFSNWENKLFLRMIIFQCLLEYSDEVSMQKDERKRDDIAYLKAYDLVQNFSKKFDSSFMEDNYEAKLGTVFTVLENYFNETNEGK